MPDTQRKRARIMAPSRIIRIPATMIRAALISVVGVPSRRLFLRTPRRCFEMRSPTPRAGIGTAVTPTGRSIGTRRTAGATTESTGMAARIRLADWWCHPRSVPDSETNGFDVWCKDSSMNIFGAREHIAVQAELLEPAGKSVVGHICLLADGMQIGSYEEP